MSARIELYVPTLESNEKRLFCSVPVVFLYLDIYLMDHACYMRQQVVSPRSLRPHKINSYATGSLSEFRETRYTYVRIISFLELVAHKLSHECSQEIQLNYREISGNLIVSF